MTNSAPAADLGAAPCCSAPAAACAPTCQKSDWKKHKRICKPFKLETISGKGLGLVATRPISQGDLLIREKATLMLPLNSSDKVTCE